MEMMIITVLVRHAMENSTNDLVVEIDETTTMPNLFAMLDIPWGDFSEYYQYSGMYYFNRETLPFLFVDKQILYDVAYTDARVIDFIATHQIDVNKEKLRVLTGYPMAGGLGAPDIIALWTQAYPILEQISVAFTILDFSVKIIKSIGKKFENRRKAPNIVFDVIYTRSQWNQFELAELLQLEPEYIKHLLKALGYVYDRKKMAYVQSEYIDDIRNKLNELPPIDC